MGVECYFSTVRIFFHPYLFSMESWSLKSKYFPVTMRFPCSLFFSFLFVNLMIIGSICLSCLPIQSKVVLEGRVSCFPNFARVRTCVLLLLGRINKHSTFVFNIWFSPVFSFVFLCTAVLSGLDSLVFVNLILEILLKLIGTGHTWLSLNWLKNSISLTIFVALLTIP